MESGQKFLKVSSKQNFNVVIKKKINRHNAQSIFPESTSEAKKNFQIGFVFSPDEKKKRKKKQDLLSWEVSIEA